MDQISTLSAATADVLSFLKGNIPGDEVYH
jgi:hypothetical protein